MAIGAFGLAVLAGLIVYAAGTVPQAHITGGT